MKLFVKIIFGAFLAVFVLTGVLALLGTALGLTFGLVGGAISLVWGIVSNPVLLILIVVGLVFMLNQKAKAG